MNAAGSTLENTATTSPHHTVGQIRWLVADQATAIGSSTTTTAGEHTSVTSFATVRRAVAPGRTMPLPYDVGP
jgi:hypothetical protein